MKGKFSKYIILIIIIAIVVYTAACIIVKVYTGYTISNTLTKCWFLFWAVELINLMLVKRGKLQSMKKDGAVAFKKGAKND